MLGVAFHYFRWHYSNGIQDFFRVWGNFIWFFFNFFSITLLLGTLFSPFHRLDEGYAKGLYPSKWLETFIVNTLMRLIGACIRLFLIAVGCVALVATLGFGTLVFMAWIAAPVVIGVLIMGGVFFIAV
jgi:hypothetical protein